MRWQDIAKAFGVGTIAVACNGGSVSERDRDTDASSGEATGGVGMPSGGTAGVESTGGSGGDIASAR